LRTLTATVLFGVCFSMPFSAHADPSKMLPYDLLISCKEALAAGNDAKPIVDEILRRDKMPLAATNVYEVLTCMQGVTGRTYRYDNQKFRDASREIEEEEASRLAETKRRSDEKQRAAAARVEKEVKEAAKRAREQEYLSAVVDTCNEEYFDDRFRALTTPICGEVFKSLGLPAN
jgi:hypothetical protein